MYFLESKVNIKQTPFLRTTTSDGVIKIIDGLNKNTAKDYDNISVDRLKVIKENIVLQITQ